MNSEMVVIIPMAGLGTRFSQSGWNLPKPFIDVKGKMMVARVIDNIFVQNAKIVLVIRPDFFTEYKSRIKKLQKDYNVDIVSVAAQTKGAACTVLAARHLFRGRSIVVVDCDNVFKKPSFELFLNDAVARNLDVSLLAVDSDNPSYSYVKIGTNGLAIEIAEKRVISSNAVCGAYYFRDSDAFIEKAVDMIIYENLFKNELYMSQVCQCFVEAGHRVGIFRIDNNSFLCMGTPEQLKNAIALI